jgi:fructose-1,6-bisphosphatase II / sedoheptulose-1,7-bisphosphatase
MRYVVRKVAVRAVEAAALACVNWIGRGREKEADQAAVDAIRSFLNVAPFSAVVAIGEGERDKAPMLYVGETLGSKASKVPDFDIALDPLEGTTLCANAMGDALSVIAVSRHGNMLHAPDVYMDKIAVGGTNLPSDLINLDDTPAKNLSNVALAKKCAVSDLVVCILDRPRHKELIAKVREAGSRIKLIMDGDISAVIAASLPDDPVDVYMGIGGAPEGVLAAASLMTMGGQMCGRLLFQTQEEKESAAKLGIQDLNRQYRLSDMVAGDVIFAAAGVTPGSILNGVRRRPDGRIIVNSMVMDSLDKTYSLIDKCYII